LKVKTMNSLKLSYLVAAAGFALALPALADGGKGGNGGGRAGSARAAASHGAAQIHAVGHGNAAHFGGARFTGQAGRSIVGMPRADNFNYSATRSQLARQHSFQNAAASRAFTSRSFRYNQSSRNFADQRDRGSDHHWDRDSHHNRDWWRRYHRHDRVVFVDGAWLYNPFYYDNYYAYEPDYYDDEPAPVYYDAAADDATAVEVQRELRREGYYRGPIDGVIGPSSRQAIAAYQRDNGLTPTGRINGPLLDSLGLT
jgi:hypothetical protein